MKDSAIFDVIIVGGGPAGLAAGIYSRRATMHTLLLERRLLGGQIAISKDVENYPGIEGITGFELAERMTAQARSTGLEIEEREVVEVVPGVRCHAVRLDDGTVLRATALIIAAGGTARKLNVPGEEQYLGSGVSYCATCDGPFFRDRAVVVIGGGDTAVEESVYLARLARSVTLVHRGTELRATRILQERLHAVPNIEVMRSTIVTAVNGDGRSVRSIGLEQVETGERRELPADGIFILIGYEPNTRLVPPEIDRDPEGFVITDLKCATNVPGIFVAGDLRRKYANQIVIASADGATAALAASRYVEARPAEVQEAPVCTVVQQGLSSDSRAFA